MAGFHYEKGLPHQERAVEAVLSVFDRARLESAADDENPQFSFFGKTLQNNISDIQRANGIEGETFAQERVLDIAMETGTGKTYTYAKTMLDLHRHYGVFKFVVVVPTLSIKAGTQNFLQSPALARHFRLDFEGAYGETELVLYVVESQKAKAKKAAMPSEIVRFVQADDRRKIHVLLINAGMLNSPMMNGTDKGNDGSTLIKDRFHIPFDALAATRPFVIVDEPHKFPTEKKTWENLLKLKPQFIVRYGATFNGQYFNLLYRLTAVDAFNDDLVKGIRVFVEEIEGDNGARIQLADLDGREAAFELQQKGGGKKHFRLGVGDALSKVHSAIADLHVAAMNKTTVQLSNGLELKKGGVLNPYSYADTVTDKMMRQAVRKHFEVERELLTREGGRIKPLTLFFIDDIAGYREESRLSGSLKNRFESYVKAEAEGRLKTESDAFYRKWLQTTLADIEATHGGYFAQDNSDKDEKIEKQVYEILHDKERLLSPGNPRRFIFSKWTLREGWDNPNVFQICKLRSSGSETSKLQEVGRGLRLPVNEYMARVKDRTFFLNYFVDGSEGDFVEKLTGEVNRSVAQEAVYSSLNDELIAKIRAAYPDETKRSISNALYEAGWVDENDSFIGNGFAETRKRFAEAFQRSGRLKDGKIEHSGKALKKVRMRTGKYDELRALWEAINRKAILQYKIESEKEFATLFYAYLIENKNKFSETGIRTARSEIRVENRLLTAVRQESAEEMYFEPICTMRYREFLLKLSQTTLIKMQTLHEVFYRARHSFKIERFLNPQTIHAIKHGFNRFLLLNSFTDFQVGYEYVGGGVHPTKFTDSQGRPLAEVNAADLGTQYDEGGALPEYLFESVFFDSDLERDNMMRDEVQEVVVFTKIPKNSIKIPVAGGATYSPDFAYVVKTAKGDLLNFVLETKNVVDEKALRLEENKKIRHAQQLFEAIGHEVKVVFQTQFEGERACGLIRNALSQIEAGYN